MASGLQRARRREKNADHWPVTTNLLERLFVEERRRTKIIPNFFHGERPVLKLMYAALIRGAERWRGIHMSVFETLQTRSDPPGAQ